MASERSERDTYRGNTIENRGCLFIYLLASEHSERDTYRGKNEKIGDVCWRASVASETVLGVDNAKSGICYIYICMYIWMVRMLFKRARGERFSPKNTAI